MHDRMRDRAYRSPLGRARGLGASSHGVGHAIAMRVTSLALIPLTLWFVWALTQLNGAGQAQAAAWLAQPLNATLMLAMVVVTFYHMFLGAQSIALDYIQSETLRQFVLYALQFLFALAGLASVVAIISIL